MASAFVKPYLLGRQAFEQGLKPADCPYEDVLSKDGRPTFSRAFRTRWMLGWMDAKHGLPVRYVAEEKKQP